MESLLLPRCCCEGSTRDLCGPDEAADSSLLPDAPRGRAPCSPQCFMFRRSRRNALVKRLWKHRQQLLLQHRRSASASTSNNNSAQQQHPHQQHSQQHETRSAAKKTPGSSFGSNSVKDEELEVKGAMHALLKRLKEAQLQSLVAAVEAGGAEQTACVLLPRADVQRLGARRALPPHVLCCLIWRYPDLLDAQVTPSNPSNAHSNTDTDRLWPGDGVASGNCTRLKPVPYCSQGNQTAALPGDSSTSDPGLVCCNPYHWSRVLEPGQSSF